MYTTVLQYDGNEFNICYGCEYGNSSNRKTLYVASHSNFFATCIDSFPTPQINAKLLHYPIIMLLYKTQPTKHPVANPNVAILSLLTAS